MKDFYGLPVEVGDEVTYTHTTSRSSQAYLRLGVVVSISSEAIIKSAETGREVSRSSFQIILNVNPGD